MDRTRITQQKPTTTPPPRGESAQPPPLPKDLWSGAFQRRLQWALEGPGWGILRSAVDFVLVCAAVVLALGGVNPAVEVSADTAPLLALGPLVLLLFHVRGLYRPRLRVMVLDGVLAVLGCVSVAAMAVAVLGMLLNGQLPAQSEWLEAWFLAVLGVGLGRAALSYAQRRARARRLVGKPVLILGAGMVGAQVARRLERHPEYGLIPIGFLDEDPRPVAEVGGRAAPVLGTIEELQEIIERTGVRNLIVAFSLVADARVSRLIQHSHALGVEVSVVPRMFAMINDRVSYDTFGGLPLLSLTHIDPTGLQFAVKHALDRILALAALIVLSPVLLCAAIAVRLSSPGPTLFSQRRVGRDGRVFNFYKFRSMRVAPEASEAAEHGSGTLDFLVRGDTAPGGVEGEDRRTGVGRILRRTSIDELPQLFNVLRGEMSLVGPRPERPEFVEVFRQDILRYGDRHRVKSGITGWAQVHGLRGQTSLAERVEWDNHYIAHWSLALDLKILALTPAALLRHTG
jgi:exopolysaccharide biosynthesis polyprenyl glycosylphosphotransferase